MRYYFILLISLGIMMITSCDPAFVMFLKNETGEQVVIKVDYDNRYNIIFDSVRYTNNPILSLKYKSIDSLALKKPLIRKDNSQYSFILDNQHIALVEPITIGRPIKRIVYKTQTKEDTLFVLSNGALLKDLKAKGLFIRKGLGTNILYLRKIK